MWGPPGWRGFAVAGISIAALGVPVTAAAPAEPETTIDYVLVDLGTGGLASAGAVGLNADGVAVGCANELDGSRRPVRWEVDGSVTMLDGEDGCAYAINSSGVAVGAFDRHFGNDVVSLEYGVAARWDPDGASELLPEVPAEPSVWLVSSAASDIADTGTMVGHTTMWTDRPGSRGTRWAPDGTPDHPGDAGESWSAVNEHGVIGGTYRAPFTMFGIAAPHRWTPEGGDELLTTTGSPPPPDSVSPGQVNDVNDAGVAVGRTTLGGAWWEPDASYVSLPLHNAVALNDAGRVVGNDDVYCDAEWWDAEHDAHLLPGLGGSCVTANDINDAGVIAGSALTASGVRHAVLWRPVEVPVTTTTTTTTSPSTTSPSTTTTSAPPAVAAVPVAAAPRFTG